MICIWSSWCHCHATISCFIKIQNGSPFWCWLTQIVVVKGSLSECCVWCVMANDDSHYVKLSFSETITPHLCFNAVCIHTQIHKVKYAVYSTDTHQLNDRLSVIFRFLLARCAGKPDISSATGWTGTNTAMTVELSVSSASHSRYVPPPFAWKIQKRRLRSGAFVSVGILINTVGWVAETWLTRKHGCLLPEILQILDEVEREGWERTGVSSISLEMAFKMEISESIS